ncbi:short-chain dehydrogenase [Microdochium bolleyi]|uniref:Short-chain dehydrogenase n=1 Tax=Microdochium bolleyi TaxID=196109 RepID=A0A136IZA7_9PEZI|nr:short-chain dehydrogenase [Microdochium bolleyi]
MDFKCALVTGGGGGIGRALSEYFISKSVKVILVGRTESNLQSTAKEIGAAAYYVLDTGNTAAIPEFVARVTREHPEIDCLVNNAGIQRPLDATKDDAETFLEKADKEIDVNIRGPMHLALHFLPHFRGKQGGQPQPCTIMNVSSGLGFVPFSIINPVYNGTKAWVHFWSLNLRTQLGKQGGGLEHVRVVEIVPPMVESDLHREREDPDDNKKKNNNMALTMAEFMKDVTQGLEGGKTTVGAGMALKSIEKWEGAFGGMYEDAAKGWGKK